MPAEQANKGVMTGREFAAALATELGAAVRVFPDDQEWAIVTVDGRVPVLVREYRAGSIGAHVPGGLYHGGGPADFDAARLATFRAAAFAWLTKHPDTLEMYGIALALLDAFAAQLGERWTVHVPGTPAPVELSLRTATGDYLNVSADRVVHGQTYKIQSRAHAAAAIPRIIGAIRASRVEGARYAELRATLDAAARSVADQLAAATSLPTTIARSAERTLDSKVVTTISCGERTVTITLDASTRAIRVHAGIAGQRDAECALADVSIRITDLVAALAAARATLTVDDLRVGARYRVLAKVGELSAGDEVTYRGLDDIDNHYGEYMFDRADGKRLVAGGDCSTPEHGPLGDAHRYLEPI